LGFPTADRGGFGTKEFLPVRESSKPEAPRKDAARGQEKKLSASSKRFGAKCSVIVGQQSEVWDKRILRGRGSTQGVYPLLMSHLTYATHTTKLLLSDCSSPLRGCGQLQFKALRLVLGASFESLKFDLDRDTSSNSMGVVIVIFQTRGLDSSGGCTVRADVL